GHFYDDAGVPHAAIFGEDLPLDASSFTITDNAGFNVTVTVTEAGPDPQNPQEIKLSGPIAPAVPFAEIVPGDYDVSITSPTAGTLPFDFVYFDVSVPVPDVFGGSFFAEGTGTTRVMMHAALIPDVTSVTINGGVFSNQALSNLNVTPDTEYPDEFNIEGTVPFDISQITPGNFEVTINSPTAGQHTFFDVFFDVFTPSVEFHGVDFQPDPANNANTEVWLYGMGFTQIPTGAITGVRVSYEDENFTAPYTVTGITVIDDNNIRSIIAGLSMDDMQWGTYYVEISITGETPIVFDFGFGPENGIFHMIIGLGDGGQTTAWMESYNFDTSDIQQIRISMDQTFSAGAIYDVSAISVLPGAGHQGNDLIVGQLSGVLINDIAEGEYWVELTTVSGGTLQPFGWFHHPGGPPPVTGGIQIFYFGIEPELSSTYIYMGTEGLTLANVLSVQISQDQYFSSGPVYDVTGLEFFPDEGYEGIDEIEGEIVGTGYSDLPEGLYFVKVTTTTGDVYAVMHDPFEKEPLPPLADMTFAKIAFGHYSPGVTFVVAEGEGFAALYGVDGLTMQVSDLSFAKGTAANVTFPVNVDIDELDDNEEGTDMLFGFINAPASDFAAGNYFVRLSGTGINDIDSPALPAPAGFIPDVPVIYAVGSPFHYEFEPGETRFDIAGDLLDQITITSIDVSQDRTFATIFESTTDFNIYIDDEGAIDMIEGTFNRPISDFTPGNYYFRLNHTTGAVVSDAFNFGGAEPPPVDVIEMFEFSLDEIDATSSEIQIFGVGFELLPATGLQIEVSIDPGFTTFYTVQNITVQIGVTPEGDDVITGTVEAPVSAFQPGMNYYVNVSGTGIDETFFPVFYEEQLPPLADITFSKLFFAHYNPGVTFVLVEGEGFAALYNVDGLTMQLSDLSFAKGTSVGVAFPVNVEIGGIEDKETNVDVMFGFINAPASDFTAGDYSLRLSGAGIDNIDSPALSAPAGFIPDAPVIYATGGTPFHPQDMGLTTGFEIPGDLFDQITITSVDVSQDRTFATIFESTTDFEVGIDGSGALDFINGTFNRAISDFTPGNYYFRLNHTTGTVVSDAFYFGGAEPPPVDVIEMFEFSLYEIDAQFSWIEIYGHGFELLPASGLQVEISIDPGFTTFYSVQNITVQLDATPEDDDMITGTVEAPLSAFQPGMNYYVHVSGTGIDETFFPVFYEEEQEEEIIFDVIMYREAVNNFVSVFMVTEPLSTEGITTVEVSADQTFQTGDVYPVSNFTFVTPPPDAGHDGEFLTGVIETDFDSFSEGDYYVLVSNGVDSGYGGPFTVEWPFAANLEVYAGAAGVSEVRIIGAELQTVTGIEISMDETFASGSSFPVTITNVNQFGGDMGLDEILGTIPQDFSTFPSGDYFVKLITPTEEIIEGEWYIESGGPYVPVIELYEVLLNEYDASTTDIVVYGYGFEGFVPADYVITVSPDPTFTTFFTLRDITVTLDINEYGVDLLSAFIDVPLNDLPPADVYYVRVDDGSGAPLMYPVEVIKDVIFELALYRSSSGQTNVLMTAVELSNAGLTGIEISQDETFSSGTVYPVTISGIFPETGDAGEVEEIIVGTIPADFDALTEGNYYIRLTAGTKSRVEGPFPMEWPFTAYLEVMPGTAGTSDVLILGAELLLVTGIEISLDETFAGSALTVTIGNVTQFGGEFGFDEITGTIDQDYSTIPPGDYYVKLITATGEIIQGDWYVEGSEGPPTDMPDFLALKMRPEGTDQTEIGIRGNDLESLVGNITSAEISPDPQYNEVYAIHSVEVRVDVDASLEDEVYGLIDRNFGEFTEGDYYFKFRLASGDSLMFPLYFEIEFEDIIWSLDLFVFDGNTDIPLVLGTSPSATDGIDPHLGEVERPPFPPAGTFVARFTGLDIGNGLSIDLRNDMADHIEWTVDIRRASTGDVINFSWNFNQAFVGELMLQDPFGGILFNVDMRSTGFFAIPAGLQQVKIVFDTVPVIETDWFIDYAAGWNLVSLGADAPNKSITALFPGAVSAFEFDGLYNQVDSLVPGKGYWLNLADQLATTVTGNSLDNLSITLNEGWNLVGTVSSDIPVFNIQQNPPGSIASIYGFDRGYKIVYDMLFQGQGYWVKARNNATITFASSAFAAPKHGTVLAQTDHIASDYTQKLSLSFTAGSVNRMIDLFIGDYPNTRALNDDFELPPKPPSGIFDVRIEEERTNGLSKAFIDGKGYREKAIALSVPFGANRVTVRWNSDALEPDRYFLTDGFGGVLFKDVDLAFSNELTVPAAGLTMLKFVLSGPEKTVTGYDLYGNYPNPFNPTTEISYYLKESGQVKLTVYNVVGQEIKTLVSAYQPSGKYTVQWDATDKYGYQVAGGIYIYKLNVNDFHAVKKMILLK
ncbi:T9SS type A sorting domain-containing protein, partial [candidate division KSB1 bacterium]